MSNGTVHKKRIPLYAKILLGMGLGIDRPLDMLRTVVNVTGGMTVSCVVDNNNKVTSD